MARQAAVILSTVLVFGILVPWYKGFTFLDPRIQLAYGLLAVLFVAPASAESAAAEVAKEPELGRSSGAVLGRMALVVAYGWGVALVILITGLVTLNLSNWRGRFAGPPSEFLAAVWAFSLAASFTVAALSGVLARRFSAGGVKSILRIGFLLVLLALAFGNRFLPERWQIIVSDYSTRRALTRVAWQGSTICAALTLVLLVLLMRRTR